jgi:hypothetical protein
MEWTFTNYLLALFAKPPYTKQYTLVVEENKLNKIDVGFFSQKGKLEKGDLRLNRSERFHFVCCSEIQ